MLHLTLLGQFAAAIDGHAITHWPRKSALLLLQLLAIAPEHRITRNEAAQALAHDTDDEQLRQVSDALYALRSRTATGPEAAKLGDYVGASSDAIWLDTTGRPIEIDLVRFEQAANEALAADARSRLPLLEAATAQFGGPLLSGVLPALESAVAPMRMHVEQLYLGCARALVGEYMQLGQGERVIVALQNVLRIVPSDEESHRQLIELYATLGRYHEAEQQLQLCRAVLARELGLKPSAATIESIRVARERRLAGQQAVARPDIAVGAAPEPRQSYTPPRSLVQLIGRAADVEHLVNQLGSAQAPALLTLCGIGGVGKTQLALEVARRLAKARKHGTAVVDLTHASDAGEVARTVAIALGIKRTDNRSWAERLQQHLAPLDLLLVLDNFEHVHRAAPWLASLLEQSPALNVLCTSRYPLLLRGEQVFDVEPLVTQHATVAPEPGNEAKPSDAAALFLRAAHTLRVQAVDAARDLPLIEQLCRRLDGLPLAIELAAARATVIGVGPLLDELRTTHVALHNPLRDAAPRHTSLQDLLQSTCAILDHDSKIALGYAAHFEAGFTLRQLADSGLFTAAESERILARLIEARIVSVDMAKRADLQAEPVPRFRLFETIRSYARYSAWMEEEERQRTTKAFVDAWYRFARRVSDSRHTPAERENFDQVEREFENIAGAIRLAARVDRSLASGLIAHLFRACQRRGYLYDAIGWIEDGSLLDDSDEITSESTALRLAACVLYAGVGRYPLSQRYGEQALARVTASSADEVSIHVALAHTCLLQSEWPAGAMYARRGLTSALAICDERGELDARILLSMLDHRSGRYGEAQTHAARARDICVRRGIEMPHRLVGTLALSKRFAGDIGGAATLYEATAARCREQRDWRAKVMMKLDQSECDLLALNLPRARESLLRVEGLCATHRINMILCMLHQQWGVYRLLNEEPHAAVEALNLSMEIMPPGSHLEQSDITLLWLVHAHLAAGNPDAAYRAAVRLTSPQTKIRRYMEPFAVDTVASTFAVTDASAAAALRNAANRLRERDGLVITPAEERLLNIAGARPLGARLEAEPRHVRWSPAQLLDGAIALCHEALLNARAGYSTTPMS